MFDRRTTETQIHGQLTIDGEGRYDIRTGIRFFDHMLELFTRHGGFDLTLKATGDLDVDQHHTVEDVGIVLGEAVLSALGDRKGINRAGYFVMPMDETLAVVAIDLSGRPHAVVDLKVRVRMVGDLQSELVHDFFDGFAAGARANVHAKVLYGRSSHHHVEAVFKAFARALRVACARDERLARMLPSTKGTPMIGLVDYGAGNLTSVRKALTALGAEFSTPERPGDCARATALIVPGVGHFAATGALDREWREAIGGAVRRGVPLFGICVGMQWLFEGSDEAPDVPGLGVIPGRIARLHGNADRRLKVPHVGWNALDFRGTARLLRGLPTGSQVYFTHSYAAPVTPECVAATTHANTFSSVVERDNVFGVQFHPEKSGDAGLRILRNFLEAAEQAPFPRSGKAGGPMC
jgi:imidazoleglycerol-phosphate dehydratase